MLTSLAATTGIGTINVLATFIAIWLVDRAGRKPLLIAGVLGMVATLAVLGLAFPRRRRRPGSGNLGLITVVCLAAYIVFFAFSLGPIVWLMISEIYPLRNRAQAMAVSTAANWGANFLVSLTFPILTNRLGIVGDVLHLRGARRPHADLRDRAGSRDEGEDAGGDQRALAVRHAGGAGGRWVGDAPGRARSGSCADRVHPPVGAATRRRG